MVGAVLLGAGLPSAGARVGGPSAWAWPRVESEWNMPRYVYTWQHRVGDSSDYPSWFKLTFAVPSR